MLKLQIAKAIQKEILSNIKMINIALAGVAWQIECWPVNQRVASLIPRQSTCLGGEPGPNLGVHEKQPHIDVSHPLFLLPLPSL